ncbi:MAG TPA: hypothetical protein VGB55_07080, partial [Tepidisphaeraceae bacterium]
MSDKLQISWDDLSSDKVEQKLVEQQAVAGTQQHYEHTQINVPTAARRFGFLYNAIFYLSLFGAIGGGLGWAFGEILHYRPDAQAGALELIRQYDEIVTAQHKIQATPEQIDKATRPIMRAGENNVYFQIHTNQSLGEEEKARQTQEQLRQDEGRDFIANLLFYGVSGVAIAAML